MSRSITFLTTAACVGAVVVAGCGRSRRAAGPAADLPAAFTPVEWAPAGVTGQPQEGCPIRFRDDRDGTTLLLRRSVNRRETGRQGDATVARYFATGNYEVLTPGRYGVSAEQWLRVDCTTRRPIGPVARSG